MTQLREVYPISCHLFWFIWNIFLISFVSHFGPLSFAHIYVPKIYKFSCHWNCSMTNISIIQGFSFYRILKLSMFFLSQLLLCNVMTPTLRCQEFISLRFPFIVSPCIWTKSSLWFLTSTIFAPVFRLCFLLSSPFNPSITVIVLLPLSVLSWRLYLAVNLSFEYFLSPSDPSYPGLYLLNVCFHLSFSV